MEDTEQQHWLAWADRLARRRWLLLAVAGIVSAAMWWPASQLDLDESIESFYGPNDPFLRAYQESKRTFGGDEFVIVGYRTESLLTPDGKRVEEDELRSIREFSRALSNVPGIRAESTQDLASTLRNPRASGVVRLAMRLPTFEGSMLDLSRRILIGDDNQTVAIVLRLEDERKAPVPRRETYREIRRLAAEHQPPAYVAGEPLQVFDMFRYVEDDGMILGLASSGLLMAVILLLFRNLRWVILPLLIIHVTLLWTRGVLYLSGLKLSMVSSMLTSLVTIIGIATVMHVTVTFRELRNHHSRVDAFRYTFARLASPIFWTCLTTAIGFGALLSSSITPVRSFALMMALGTLLVPLVCLLILPGGILIGRAQADPAEPLWEGWLSARLKSLAHWSSARPASILLITCALAALAVAGLLRLSVETDFSKNFRESSPIVRALHFFEGQLGGVGSWDVSFSAPPELSEEFLEKVRDLAEELRQIRLNDGTQLTKVVALTDGLDLIPRIPVGNDERRGGLFRVLPRFRTPLLEERREMLADLQPEMEQSLYSPSARRMRIVLRALEQQPAEVKLQLIDKVEETARRHFPDARASGLYVLLAYLIQSLLSDQLVSFGLATAGVALCMTIAFRSLRLGMISIFPNVLPILLVVGGMGWGGLPINIGTAMIASVSMGLTVDSTIHYLTAYQRARHRGESHLAAVEFAHGSVGLALSLANFALIIGFSVLTLSNFVPLVYFGLLVSVTMLGGLLGNLLLLPVLLKWGSDSGPVTSSAVT